MTGNDTRDRANEFERLAGQKRVGVIAEFWDFLKHNKKWWLLPILLVILALGAMVLLAGTPLGPFIYTVF